MTVKKVKNTCKLISFKDGTWAVIDSAGRYDGSNGGDVEGLHWVVGNEPIALSQLRDRYYEPGLLAKVMGFDKTPLRDVQAFDHVKLYPEVTTTADPSGAANRVAVHLTERGGGIGRVQVYVNDVLFQDDARPAGADSSGKTLDFTVDLSAAPTLRPGGLAANDIRVVAYNGENWLPSRSVALSRGANLLTAPPVAGDANMVAKRRLFAVVAGTSDYAAPALQLKFPARDAVAFAEALKLGAADDPLIERPDIALLASGPGTPAGTLPPTKTNLKAAFARSITLPLWRRKAVKPAFGLYGAPSASLPFASKRVPTTSPSLLTASGPDTSEAIFVIVYDSAAGSARTGDLALTWLLFTRQSDTIAPLTDQAATCDELAVERGS